MKDCFRPGGGAYRQKEANMIENEGAGSSSTTLPPTPPGLSSTVQMIRATGGDKRELDKETLAAILDDRLVFSIKSDNVDEITRQIAKGNFNEIREEVAETVWTEEQRARIIAAIKENFLMVDSGTYDHVCPKDYATQYPLYRETTNSVKAASGNKLKHFGTRYVDGYIRDVKGEWAPATIRFEVHDIKDAMLSTRELRRTGTSSVFDAKRKEDYLMLKNGQKIKLKETERHSWV